MPPGNALSSDDIDFIAKGGETVTYQRVLIPLRVSLSP